MEIHRLKPMSENYDRKLFNDLYKRTESLRRKLSYQVDNRRFGVSKDQVLSWFDDKFIHTFNKYAGQGNDGVLLGNIIRSLENFKNRILRKAYTEEYITLYANNISIDEFPLINVIADSEEMSEADIFVNLATAFIKERISEEAFQIFEIELNPPLYIIDKLPSSNSHIPSHLILDFLGIDITKRALDFVSRARREIKEATEEARLYFIANQSLI